MQVGAYCVHRAWGMGRIRQYDAVENRLIIDFEEGREGHAMDPAFCIEKLDILGPDDLLVKSRVDPERVQEMIKKDPAEVIVEILSQLPEHTAGNTEIEAVLSRLIGPTKYKKWWTATKKVLAKDPRIAVPVKKTDPWVLRDEPVKPEDEVLEEFFETKAPKKKINFANKLVEMSVKHADIEEALPEILQELAASLAETKQLTLGERLYGIWVRNDLARFIHSDVESLEPTSHSILIHSKDLSGLADEIPATHHKRYIDLIKRTFPDDWSKHIFELLKNSSGKLTGECINFLMEAGLSDDITKTFQRWLVEQNLKGPVLGWILKNRASRKYGKMLSPMINSRLLSAIFWAIDYEALQTAGTRRIPLAEQLLEDPDLIGDLLATATPETAHDLAQTLLLNQGFEDLSKKSLLARFIKLFPSVQGLVSGQTGAEAAEESLFVSQASYEARKAEYEELVGNRIPRNKEDIAEARAHGDLKENAEYKMARQEQDLLLARKSDLERDLARVQVTDFSEAPEDIVGIGSTVDLVAVSTGAEHHYAILGAWDSDPEKDILSYQTPLARALTGQSEGNTVEIDIDGHREAWQIKAIGRWVDSQSK
ncbi:MAG: GreA/GreB family elongation factor [Verrucomicrobiota bacterium]